MTGVILKQVARMQGDTRYRKGLTVARLALNIGNILEGIIPGNHNLPKDMMFDDDLYFAKEEEEEQVDSPWNDSFGVEYVHNVIFQLISVGGGLENMLKQVEVHDNNKHKERPTNTLAGPPPGDLPRFMSHPNDYS